MKLSRATIALYLGLVFACGGVVGFFANRLYTATTVAATGKGATAKSPVEYRKQLMDMFQARLKLAPEQMQELGIILDETQAQLNAIHAQEDPQIDAVRQSQITRMKLMLHPDQESEYDKMLQELRERQKQQRRPGGGRPGGPGF
jgi:hypothetical protein